MPIQYINTGSSANAGNGDSIRLAFDKVNRNFSLVQSNLNSLSEGYFTNVNVANTATLKNLTVTGTTYLNNIESASFYNNTYFENIVVSDKSTLNHVTATDVTVTGNAKIDTLDVLTSLSVGSYQIAAINDYNDFSIIKNDANGLAVVLLNTNADSNSKLVVKDNISGGLAILHQNVTNLAGDFVAGENYIYGETPTDVIHIGAYSDLKFSASQDKYYNPALPETPSMVIQSIDGAVHVYSSATFHSDVYGITGAGANAGTLDRLTSQDLSKVVTLNNNGSLVPSADLTYDLGSTSSQWRSLYIGTSTIYLGGTALSIVGNTLTIDGSPIQAGGGGTVWTNDANGCLRAELSSTGFEAFTDASHLDLQDSGKWNIGSYQNSTFIGNDEFTNTNILSLKSGDETYITTNLRENGNYQWKFGTDGVLTLPGGNTRIGNVFGTDGILGSTGTGVGVGSQGIGGYAALQWIDNPEDATSAAAIVVNSPIASSSGTVQIVTGIVAGPTAENVWEFGADGSLTIPGDIQDTNGSLIFVATTSTAPTRVDGLLWFNSEEGRTYIKYNGQWVDASPTIVPEVSTYLDEITIDGSTLNINDSTLTISNTGTLLVNGQEITGSGEYTPSTPNDWSGSPTVGTVTAGLDELASRMVAVEGGGASGWQLTSSTVVVSLASDGKLTLPNGGIIFDNDGPGGGWLSIAPANAGIGQALVLYPTQQDGNHIHLTANGNNTDLYLGSDDQYVKVDHSGTIVIGTLGANTSIWTFGTDGVLTLSTSSTILGNSEDPNVYIETSTTATTSTWTFGTDGVLTLPQGSTISETNGGNVAIVTNISGVVTGIADLSNQGGWNQYNYINTATTGGSGTGLTVDVVGGGYINITNITINNPGSGYTEGDVITINNENNLPAQFTISTVTNVLSNWTFSNTGTVTFPDATVQRTAYTSGQQTVFVNAASTVTDINLTELNGTVIVIFPENGYAVPGETHNIYLPFQFMSYNPNIPLGTRITVINQYNGTVNIGGWPGPGTPMIEGDVYDLIYIYNDSYGGNLWYITNYFNPFNIGN